MDRYLAPITFAVANERRRKRKPRKPSPPLPADGIVYAPVIEHPLWPVEEEEAEAEAEA